VKKKFAISGTVLGLTLSLLVHLNAQQQARSEPAMPATPAILDWGGNLIESHAMEGAPMNAIDTALLKAKSALRWRRPTSETNKMVRSGENLAPTFMHDFPQPGALPIVVDGQVVGAMGVSGVDGEKCAQAAIDAVFKKQATAAAR